MNIEGKIKARDLDDLYNYCDKSGLTVVKNGKVVSRNKSACFTLTYPHCLGLNLIEIKILLEKVYSKNLITWLIVRENHHVKYAGDCHVHVYIIISDRESFSPKKLTLKKNDVVFECQYASRVNNSTREYVLDYLLKDYDIHTIHSLNGETNLISSLKNLEALFNNAPKKKKLTAQGLVEEKLRETSFNKSLVNDFIENFIEPHQQIAATDYLEFSYNRYMNKTLLNHSKNNLRPLSTFTLGINKNESEKEIEGKLYLMLENIVNYAMLKKHFPDELTEVPVTYLLKGAGNQGKTQLLLSLFQLGLGLEVCILTEKNDFGKVTPFDQVYLADDYDWLLDTTLVRGFVENSLQINRRQNIKYGSVLMNSSAIKVITFNNIPQIRAFFTEKSYANFLYDNCFKSLEVETGIKRRVDLIDTCEKRLWMTADEIGKFETLENLITRLQKKFNDGREVLPGGDSTIIDIVTVDIPAE